MQALILAGGRGLRLCPLTDDVPQTLLHLPGGTVLDYILLQLQQLPIRKTAIVLQYQGDRIARHLRHYPDVFPIPQYAPYTLLSALASAAPWVEEPTPVIHGNLFFSRPLDYFLRQAERTRPTFLIPREQQRRGEVTGSGVYLLPPEIFYQAARLVDEQRLETLVHALQERGTPPHLVAQRGWSQTIKQPPDLLKVNHFLLSKWHETLHPASAFQGYDARHCNWISPEAEVDQQVRGAFMTVAPGASVKDSYLYNSIVMPGVQMQQGREKHAILARTPAAMLRLYAPPVANAFPMA